MERTYMISFEIADENIKNKVIDAIKILGKWWNHIDKIWIVNTDSNAKTIKTYLNVFLNEKDKLIILGLDGEAEWTGIEYSAGSWLTNYISKIV